MVQRFNRCAVTSFLVCCFFACSCEHEAESDQSGRSGVLQVSPLDTILGDKIIIEYAQEIRHDNFPGLLTLRKEHLQIESSIYDINPLDENHFVISQKQSYSEARNFNILVKTNAEQIVDYVVFNDFAISDVASDSSNWILLLSDINQTSAHWKSEQQIKVVRLDSAFNEKWNYTCNSVLPLSGQSLNVHPDYYAFQVEVITGCSICYTLAE